MILTFRPIKVQPDGWKERGYWGRSESTFKASYSRTLMLLDREVERLGATAVTLQVDATDRDIRLDGQLRADARVGHPGVILTIDTRKHGTLIYATDRFRNWHDNLRAIALGLEALRKIERYGIAERGQQYAGYRELGAGLPMGPASMTPEAAAEFLIAHGEQDGADQPGDPDALLEESPLQREIVDLYYRTGAKRLHPDAGGDPDLFRRLAQARDVLLKLHAP